MRVAIVGSRDYPNWSSIINFVKRLAGKYPDTVVVSGGARGVDSVAVKAAELAGLKVEVYPADWDKHGKKAGFLRNKTIVDRADKLVAFWDMESAGTAHSIGLALEKKIPVYVSGPESLSPVGPFFTR